ncbi:hypothetical protein [Noviluteimonas gilva]|uniref:Uncharacterized protein n=1 Tax=Noviluteimonas gilva TaxID=2682097 RepID=A0A7C9LGW0_9GAMM|nr:hypothetical protein [Lysobacter gilvus]MUV13540.1 hypothetical protein [Lysobacter gilvus]
MSDFRALPHIPEGVEPGFAHVTQRSESPMTQAALDLWALQHKAACVMRRAYESNGDGL